MATIVSGTVAALLRSVFLCHGVAAVAGLSVLAGTTIGAQPHLAVTGDSTVHVGGWHDLRGWGELFKEYFQPDVPVHVTA